MIEYALLILGIGLVVYNGAKLVFPAIDQFASYMATHEVETIRSLAEEQNDEEEEVS